MTLFRFFFFFNDTATTEIYTLSLHDALPISGYGLTLEDELKSLRVIARVARELPLRIVPTFLGAHEIPLEHRASAATRSEEHTSELQSPCNLVCRLLLETKN